MVRDLLRDIRRKSSDVSLLLNKNRINVDDVSGRDPVTLQQEVMEDKAHTIKLLIHWIERYFEESAEGNDGENKEFGA